MKLDPNIFFLFTAAVFSIEAFKDRSRKEVNTAFSSALKNSSDWDGRRGKRIRDDSEHEATQRDEALQRGSEEALQHEDGDACNLIKESIELLL